MQYSPLSSTHAPKHQNKIEKITTVEGLGRMYHLTDGSIIPSNTTVLRKEMDANGLSFWVNKLVCADGDRERATKKTEFIGEFTRYFGTVFHRSLERCIILPESDAQRAKALSNHVMGPLFQPYDAILGCELSVLGDGYATTCDLVLRERETGATHIVEVKTIHRAGSDDAEAILDNGLDRTLQTNKVAQYRKQMGAQAAAIEHHYGVTVDAGLIFVFDTIDLRCYTTGESTKNKLNASYKAFQKLLDTKSMECIEKYRQFVTEQYLKMLAGEDPFKEITFDD